MLHLRSHRFGLAALLLTFGLSLCYGPNLLAKETKAGVPEVELHPQAGDPGLRQLGLNSGITSVSAAPGDTTWFGGTVWAADSMRWEATEGGVWTFDSGVGSHFQHAPDSQKDSTLHALMEGWSSTKLAEGGGAQFRRLSESGFGASPTCVGDVAGLGGDWSMWAGLLESEAQAAGYFTGQGYGDEWDISVRKEFVYSGSGSVTLEFDYVNQTEPGFDETTVLIDTSGTGHEVEVASYDGIVSGHATLVLQPGISLPTSAGTIAVRFRVTSDVAYSDQDGLYATDCGAFALDNIELSGAINSGLMTFESGDEGWETIQEEDRDWSNIVALSDLPPLVVPNCGLVDSVLVFEDYQSCTDLSTSQVVSPWIDLTRSGDANKPGFVLEFDMYREIQPGITFLRIGTQWDPCIDPATYSRGITPISIDETVIAYTSDECLRVQIDLSHSIPVEVEQLRIVIGLQVTCDPSTKPSPFVDNVRLGVFGTPVSVPLSQEPPPSHVSTWSTALTPQLESWPTSFGVDRFGRLYIADRMHDVVQKFDPDGNLRTFWGQLGTGTGEFVDPKLAVSETDFVFVADSQARIQKFDLDGNFLLQWNMPSSASAWYLATNSGGDVFAATGLTVNKFDENGSLLASWSAGSVIQGMTCRDGLVYVVRSRGSNEFSIPAVATFTESGQLLKAWGGTDSGEGNVAPFCHGRFGDPGPVLVRPDGEILIANRPYSPVNRVEKYAASTAFLAGWEVTPLANNRIVGLAASPSGHQLYVLDYLSDPPGGDIEGRVNVYELTTTSVPSNPLQPDPVPVLLASPNPSRSGNRLQFSLEVPGQQDSKLEEVALYLVDIQGRRVRTLHEGSLTGGTSTFYWDGNSDRGTKVAAGVYFLRAIVDGKSLQARKIIRLP